MNTDQHPSATPVTAIIVAGGTGSRFGADIPKQYCLLEGRPVLMHAIDAMRRALPGARLAVVISREMESLWHELCEEHRFDSPQIVYGGATRWESVANALSALGITGDTDGIVAIHDGARPLPSPDMTRRVIDVASRHHGAIPATAVTDSLRVIDPATGTSHPVDRSLYRAVQTPQAFPAKLLADAYHLPYNPAFTDDASVMMAAGYGDIALVEGDPCNIKITHPADIEIAAIMRSHR